MGVGYLGSYGYGYERAGQVPPLPVHEYVAIGNEKPMLLTGMNWVALRRFMNALEAENKGTVIAEYPQPTLATSFAALSLRERGSQTEAVEPIGEPFY
jgi:hypothetical protein